MIEKEVFTGATPLCSERGWEAVRTRRVSFQQKHRHIVHVHCTADMDRVVGGKTSSLPIVTIFSEEQKARSFKENGEGTGNSVP